MTQAPDEHVLAVTEEMVPPIVILVTVVLGLLFLIAVLYRIGISFL